MSRLVAIHQPNFFPWLGYFDKIARADQFIFLDDVQFPKTGGGWCNRVQLLIGNEARWFTAEIDRNYHGTRAVNEINFLKAGMWREKLVKTLYYNYRKHEFFDEVISVVEPLILSPLEGLAEYNIQAIKGICKCLSLDAKDIKASSALNVTGVSSQRLCSLTRASGGDVYMCGGGSGGYQDDMVFSAQGIGLRYQNFNHPVYTQRGQVNFVPGLSVIDAAMNLSWSGVRRILSVTTGSEAAR